MLQIILFLLCIIALANNVNALTTKVALNNTNYKLVYSNQEFDVKPMTTNVEEIYLSFGQMTDLMNERGYCEFRVNSSSVYIPDLQAYGVGFLEGFLTANQTRYMLSNEDWANGYAKAKAVPQFIAYFDNWLAYMNMMIENESNKDDYWFQAMLLMNQTQGLLDGYNAAVPSNEQINMQMLLMINGMVEIEDILTAIKYNNTMGYFKHNPLNMDHFNKLESHFKSVINTRTRCSAMIKVVGNDLMMSHCTWSGYTTMNRIIKHIDLGITGKKMAGLTTMSSYPLCIGSLDDWYITNHEIAVMETTNNVFNLTLYQYIKPTETVMTWARSMIANRLAQSGADWAATFALYNSGTCNNQWIIVDYNQLKVDFITHELKISDNAIIIIEQIPGYTHTEDVTSIVIDQTYWSSFNVPYLQDIYELSGYTQKYEETKDPEYTWNNCSRHNLFEAKAMGINNENDFKLVMRSNDYKTDPLSGGNPTNAISSRYDLLDNNPQPFGAVDCKMMTNNQHTLNEYSLVFGPTHAPQSSVPVFDWTTSPFSKSYSKKHLGMPDKFNFDWHFVQYIR